MASNRRVVRGNSSSTTTPAEEEFQNPESTDLVEQDIPDEVFPPQNEARKGETGDPAPVVEINTEVPQQPSFGISEGTRNDIEMFGETTDPFTGKKLTRADLPA